MGQIKTFPLAVGDKAVKAIPDFFKETAESTGYVGTAIAGKQVLVLYREKDERNKAIEEFKKGFKKVTSIPKVVIIEDPGENKEKE